MKGFYNPLLIDSVHHGKRLTMKELETSLYPFGQLFGAAFYCYTRYGSTELMDYQQRGLNYHFKQPEDYLNRLEFKQDGYDIICHCEKATIRYNKHSKFMGERVIEIFKTSA